MPEITAAASADNSSVGATKSNLHFPQYVQ